MSLELKSELLGNFPSTSKDYTHIWISDNNKEQYRVDKSNIADFWKMYCHKINSLTLQDGARPSIGERIKSNSPLCFFLDLKGTLDNFPLDHVIIEVVYCLQKAIKNQLEIKDTQMTYCAVCSGASSSNNNFKRLRFQFPWLNTDIKMFKYIKTEVISHLIELETLKKLKQWKIEGKWENILFYTEDYLLMYGSVINDEDPVPELHQICDELKPTFLSNDWGIDFNKDNYDYYLEPEGLFDYKNTYRTFISSEVPSEDTIDEYYPLLFSLNYSSNIVRDSRHDHSSTTFKLLPLVNYKRETKVPPIELLAQLLSLLKPERFLKEHFNLCVGQAIYSVYKSHEQGLTLWKQKIETALKMAPKIVDYLEDVTIDDYCEDKYFHVEFERSHTTIESLGWYAREDDKENYDKWHKNWIRRSIIPAAETQTDATIGELIARVFWLEHVFVKKPNYWMYYDNHRWIDDDSGLYLRKRITDEMVILFDDIILEFDIEVPKYPHDREKQADLRKKSDFCRELQRKFEQQTDKNKFVGDLKEKFNRPNFTSYLGANGNLTGVANGVIEIVNNKRAVFRSGKPQDYLNQYAPTRYDTKLTATSEKVKDLRRWLNQIYPDAELEHHVEKFFASILKSGNPDKILPAFAGHSDGGKSTIIKLLETTLKGLVVKFDISVISQDNKNAGGPSPQLARANGCKLVISDEVENVLLKQNTIKKLTGGDSIYCRKLQENGSDMEITFKILISTNNPPPFDGTISDAIINRWKIFPHLAKWLPTYKYNEIPKDKRINIYEADPNFEHKLPYLAPALLWLMVDQYPNYVTEKLKSPKIVQKYTDDYWSEKNIYLKFVKEQTIADPKYKIKTTKLYGVYKEWYQSSFPRGIIDDRPFFESEITKTYKIERGTREDYFIGITSVEKQRYKKSESKIKPLTEDE